MILRTYAFWNGDKRVLYGLLIYGLVRSRYLLIVTGWC